jgi:catechol 2,3-dioxygenase-like lactoylglutathione lyase family enzyme
MLFSFPAASRGPGQPRRVCGGTFRLMLVFHHANLGVPVGGADAEGAFLVDVLGYKALALDPSTPPSARWFESEDGKQVHLSEDPEHRPAARAHIAVEVGDGLPDLEDKLTLAHIECKSFEGNGLRIVFCEDPAGNRWELRGVA